MRVVSKDAPPRRAPAGRAEQPQPQPAAAAAATYPWDNVHFLDVPADGKVSRAMALKPGEYELFIAVKEQTPPSSQRNAPPPKSACCAAT